MVIKLKDADFSANNLGRITIDRELTPDAVAVLSHYTKSLTKLKQLAVDDFIANLKSSGIWTKFSMLQIPILANSVSECFYDIISGTQVSPASLDPFALDVNGLKLINTATNPGKVLKSFAPATNTNFHVCTYLAKNTILDPFFISSGAAIPTFWLNSGGFLDGTNTNGLNANCDGNSVKIKGAKIGTSKGITANDVDILYSGISTTTRSLAGTGVGATANISSIQHIGYANVGLITEPFSLYSMGTSMTLAEMQTYNTHMNTLMDLLIV